MSDAPARTKNILVLCIDRDDDIGSKGGVKTPIVGRDSCIHAGIRLAIEDPEEADSNAIFAAVKLYEELLSKGYSPEVALLSGTFKRGVEADEKIAYQLHDVLQKYKADGAVVVSDGIDDESVLPIIQNIVPVISVQRVVIKHSRSVEYSYAVLGRYLRSLIYDSRYSKFFLGVPGALLIVGGITAGLERYFQLQIGQYALAAVAIVLGLAFILRGFDLDKTIRNLAKFTPSSFIKVFSLVAGTMIILSSLQMGYASIPLGLIPSGMEPWQVLMNPVVIGHFVNGMLTLLWIGLGTIFGGMLLSHWFRGSLRALSDVLRLIVLALFYIPMQQFMLVLIGEGSPFTLISSLLVGLALALVAATFVYQYYRRRKGKEQLES
jgi:putative membrane protein